jgi:putative ABC transport system permease protein
MRDRHDIENPDDDDFRVTTVDEAVELVDTIVGGIQILLTVLASISLVVGGVGIMNVMYVAVAERTFEIGLRKSVGAKRSDILYQFLIESLFLTGIGGICGLVLAYGLSILIGYILVNNGINISIALTQESLIISLLFSCAVGLLFGIYPARQAAYLDPINALRKE